MVSEDSSLMEISAKLSVRLEKWLEELPILARGAESELRLGSICGVKTVFKFRRRKLYMDPKLDKQLRRSRTLKEAKILSFARSYNINVPRLLLFLPEKYLLGIEYIEGEKLKNYLNKYKLNKNILNYVKESGRLLGLLHKIGIVHGDPTTSNYIISTNNELYIIDFGLSEFSEDLEDRAVDIHLFRRAVLSTHPILFKKIFNEFINGYKEVMKDEADKVIERANNIALRGRYVEERRTVWKI